MTRNHLFKIFKQSKRKISHFKPCNIFNIDIFDGQSNINDIYHEIFNIQQPMIFKRFIHWKALNDSKYRWNDTINWSNRVQGIQVPIEIGPKGSNYMNNSVQIISTDFSIYLHHLHDLMTNRELHDDKYHLYLAQFDITNIPVLLNDIETPEFVLNTGKRHLYRRNVWISGPFGASSPCHYDPFQNLLCQVYGNKRILLFPPDQSEYLYLAKGTVQKNTSLIDFQSIDYDKYPLFERIVGLEAILDEGDCLFIPFKWFHYCESTDSSCSVNFWWL